MEVYEDSNGVSHPCLRMYFDNSHGGWGKGQRFMNLNASQNGLHEDVIIEFPYCITGLDPNTSLGAKMMPSISFGGVPPPCQPIPMNEGYISGMNRPQWRNTISGNTVIDGAVVHTYNYFHNALDPCGQHMYGYLPDGTFHLLKQDVWDIYRIRLKLNDIGQANGIYQMQINGVLASSDSNIEMRDDINVKLQKLTCELFSG